MVECTQIYFEKRALGIFKNKSSPCIVIVGCMQSVWLKRHVNNGCVFTEVARAVIAGGKQHTEKCIDQYLFHRLGGTNLAGMPNEASFI
jgi:hypothetical protein